MPTHPADTPAELFPVLDMSRPPDLDVPQMCRCVITPVDVASDDWRYKRMELTMPILAQTLPDKLRQLKKETLVRRVRRLERDLQVNTENLKIRTTTVEGLMVRIEDLKRVHAGQRNEQIAEIEHLHKRCQNWRTDAEQWKALARAEAQTRQEAEHTLAVSGVVRNAHQTDTFTVAMGGEEMDLHEGSTRVVLARSSPGGPIKVEVRKPNRAVELYEVDRVELQGIK